jgi:hypothetical protein
MRISAQRSSHSSHSAAGWVDTLRQTQSARCQPAPINVMPVNVRHPRKGSSVNGIAAAGWLLGGSEPSSQQATIGRERAHLGTGYRGA